MKVLVVTDAEIVAELEQNLNLGARLIERGEMDNDIFSDLCERIAAALGEGARFVDAQLIAGSH